MDIKKEVHPEFIVYSLERDEGDFTAELYRVLGDVSYLHIPSGANIEEVFRFIKRIRSDYKKQVAEWEAEDFIN